MLGGWLYIELIWLVQERLSNKELEMAQKNGFLGGPKIAIFTTSVIGELFLDVGH